MMQAKALWGEVRGTELGEAGFALNPVSKRFDST